MNFLATFLFNDNPWTLIIILVVILVLFGGKRIPELMRGMGSGIKEFKDAVKDDEKPVEKPIEKQNDTIVNP